MRKNNLYFDNQSLQPAPFFSSHYLLNELEHMYSLPLSSYRNTRKSAEELEKAVETPARGSSAYSISRFPTKTSTRISITRYTNTVHVFFLLNVIW